MASDDESTFSVDDPAQVAALAQQRILNVGRSENLKRERDERMSAVVAETDAEFMELRSRVVQFHEERQKQRANRRAQDVLRLAEMADKRKDIEAEMAKVVMHMHEKMKQVEDMMMAGCEGREMDAKASRDRL